MHKHTDTLKDTHTHTHTHRHLSDLLLYPVQSGAALPPGGLPPLHPVQLLGVLHRCAQA